jgi:hypothetical protein
MRPPKPLSDRILEMLPRLDAPMARDIASRLGEGEWYVREAFHKLEAEGRAKIVRRGNGLHLVPADYPGLICPVCRVEYVLPKKSKRKACSKSCGISLSWRDPETRRRRYEGMLAGHRTPESRAKKVATNNRRWSDPKQRERLSEQSRKRWADPVTKMQISVAIQREHLTPEKRALYSANIKARWDDPEGRAKLIEGTKRGKQTPQYRANQAAEMKRRWSDPVLREKYMAAVKVNGRKAAQAVKGRKQTPEHVAARLAGRTPPRN